MDQQDQRELLGNRALPGNRELLDHRDLMELATVQGCISGGAGPLVL